MSRFSMKKAESSSAASCYAAANSMRSFSANFASVMDISKLMSIFVIISIIASIISLTIAVLVAVLNILVVVLIITQPPERLMQS